MNKRTFPVWTLLVVVLTGLLFGLCDPIDIKPEEKEKIVKEVVKKGNIHLPSDANVELEQCKIVSAFDEAGIDSNGSFSIPIDGSNQQQQTVFMTDAHNNVLMLAYLNVVVDKIELSAESSAVGLFMMLTAARSQLDRQQWSRAEKLLKNTPQYAAILAEVERLIKEGKDLLSEENTELMKRYGALLDFLSTQKSRSAVQDTESVGTVSQHADNPSDSATPRGTTENKDTSQSPLVISNKGKRIIINNNGWAPAYAIKIEEEDENGNRKEVLNKTLDASKAVNIGIGDILTWQWGFFQSPSENVEYAMSLNTTHYFTADSGLPGKSKKANKATFFNTFTPVTYVLDIVGIPLGSKCVQALTEQSYNTIKVCYDAFNSSGIRDATKLFINRTLSLLGSGNVIECVLGKGVKDLTSKVAKFAIKSFDIMGKIDSGFSIAGHLSLWFFQPVEIDFCRVTDGKNMSWCGDIITVGFRSQDKNKDNAFVIQPVTGEIDNIWVDWNGNFIKDKLEDQHQQNPNYPSFYVFSGRPQSDAPVHIFGAVDILSIAYPSTVNSIDATNNKTLSKLLTDGTEEDRGQISAINIKGCENLNMLFVKYNRLSASTISRILSDLPKKKEENTVYMARFEGNPGIPTKEDIKVAKKKGWIVAPAYYSCINQIKVFIPSVGEFTIPYKDGADPIEGTYQNGVITAKETKNQGEYTVNSSVTFHIDQSKMKITSGSVDIKIIRNYSDGDTKYRNTKQCRFQINNLPLKLKITDAKVASANLGYFDDIRKESNCIRNISASIKKEGWEYGKLVYDTQYSSTDPPSRLIISLSEPEYK